MGSKRKSPFEELVEGEIRTLDKTAKMNKDLSKYGRKVGSGGMVWTTGDMQRYFQSKRKKR